jgi:signal transduction histidine kinase
VSRPVTTLRARLRLVLLAALALVVAGVIVSAGALSSLDRDSRELTDRVSPARVAAADLNTAWLDQETGLRGFVISRDESFLEPYRGGEQAAATADAAIRRYLPGTAADARLDAIAAAGKAWRADFAEPTIEKARAAPKGQELAVQGELGKARFDLLRARLDGLTAVIGAEGIAARHHAAKGLSRLRELNMLAFGLLAGAAFATLVALRFLVLKPVENLAAAARRVAGGEFDHQVSVDGPAELQALAADLDSMRGRIVTELAASREAEREIRAQAALLSAQTTELAEQSADLRRSNDELEQFAYVASHDLQEPLRKVASFCQLLQRRYGGQLDERADQYIEFAVDGARRMQQLINDLLAFSRVGRSSEDLTPVDTAAAADRAIAALATVREETGAQIELIGLPVLVGDQALLTQLFQNVIGNAIKFRSPQRSPRVVVAAARAGEDWHFTCADNGIGIDAEYGERIFVIFQRLHPKDEYAGTGIGLSLCKKIVEYHGGQIWLDTDRGEHAGTVFHWTLPDRRPEGRDA